jgi:hypothetical protein
VVLATPIFSLGWPNQGPWGGSATPKPAMGMVQATPSFKKKIKKLKLLFFLKVFRCVNVNFRQFLDRSTSSIFNHKRSIIYDMK